MIHLGCFLLLLPDLMTLENEHGNVKKMVIKNTSVIVAISVKTFQYLQEQLNVPRQLETVWIDV